MVYTNILYRSLSRKEVHTSAEADEVCLLNDSRFSSTVQLFIQREHGHVSVARR